MPNRVDLLVWLAQHRGYRRYLEIGCESDWTFRQIPCEEKTGVDPEKGGTVRATSDDYFRGIPRDQQFDLVFIDGDHTCLQVMRDCLNSLDHLADGGAIVVHDVLPTDARQTVAPGDRWGSYTGDGWRVIASLARHPLLDAAVGGFDWGCGVILKRLNPSHFEGVLPSIYQWSWKQYATRPDTLFLILPWDALLRWIATGDPRRSTAGLSAGSGLILPSGRLLRP
jgi:hypothetical protein